MYELSSEISGRPIDDIGDWPVLVSRFLDELSIAKCKEHAAVKDSLIEPRGVYVAGENFWAELKEMT